MRCTQKRKATKLFIDYIECKRAKLSINLCLGRKRKWQNIEEQKCTKKINVQNNVNVNQSTNFDLRFFSNFLLTEPGQSIANMNVPKKVHHISANDKKKYEALTDDSGKVICCISRVNWGNMGQITAFIYFFSTCNLNLTTFIEHLHI